MLFCCILREFLGSVFQLTNSLFNCVHLTFQLICWFFSFCSLTKLPMAMISSWCFTDICPFTSNRVVLIFLILKSNSAYFRPSESLGLGSGFMFAVSHSWCWCSSIIGENGLCLPLWSWVSFDSALFVHTGWLGGGVGHASWTDLSLFNEIWEVVGPPSG